MLSLINAALPWIVSRFERENGQALAEYGLILALVAVALVGILAALAVGLTGTFQAVIDQL